MIELHSSDVRCTVAADDGGRLASLRVRDRELLVLRTGTADQLAPLVDPMAWGSYPMAPFAGRVRDGQFCFDARDFQLVINHPPHAIHGTAFLQPWTVGDLTDSSISMSCTLGDHWPFGGAAHQRIELFADRIECRLAVTADDLAMPAQVGWHPWFRKPEQATLSFAAMYERDGTGIPTGELVSPPPPGPWDDCFVEPLAPIELRYTDLVVRVDSDCDHWVIYDRQHGETCVEPQSGPPDGLNALPGRPGATLLARHETLERWMSISWTTPRPH